MLGSNTVRSWDAQRELSRHFLSRSAVSILRLSDQVLGNLRCVQVVHSSAAGTLRLRKLQKLEFKTFDGGRALRIVADNRHFGDLSRVVLVPFIDDLGVTRSRAKAAAHVAAHSQFEVGARVENRGLEDNHRLAASEAGDSGLGIRPVLRVIGGELRFDII